LIRGGEKTLSKTEISAYNKYDPDIWEMKQRWLHSPVQQKRIREVLTKQSEWLVRTTRLGNGIIYRNVENFIYAVAKADKASIIEEYDEGPTVWKIVIPDLDKPVEGSNYYIIRKTKGRSLVFRGTYGYGGEGCGCSALIEACFEKLGLKFEVRDGSDLVSLGFIS